MMISLRAVLTLALAAGLSGCSILDSFISGAFQGAGNAYGESVGKQYANQHRAMWAGPMAATYTNMIFAYAFNSGGYAVQGADWKPGEYARWNMETKESKPNWIERAYLAADKDGNQWWRVKYFDGEQAQTTVLEALLQPSSGKMVRLRAKFPDDAAGKEMPVDEQAYYIPPQKLSKESLEGATVGSEKITVPAGSFTARHVVYGNPGGGNQEWWLVDSVPGGVVKQLIKGDSSGEQHEMLLAAFGKDAQSELDSIK